VNQASLNLVAITLFSLVMMSLLGPIVHLSPTVPAIATFGILSFTAIDTFGLQGRFGAIVIDSFARLSSEHRARVIRHEAGHFLVAHLSGIPITGYTLTAWEAFRQGQPGQGGVSFDTQELDQELKQGILSNQLIDRYCTVWMAGTAAETLVYGNAEGGADDRQKFRTLWFHLKRTNAEGALKEKGAIFQAKSLIQAQMQAFEALVTAMEQRASVEDCCRVIDEQQALQAT
jgi:hypothetical protein